MADQYAVTNNATGSVIKFGFVDFSSDYDPATESIVPIAENAVPVVDVPLYYQKIVALQFVEMTQAEKDVVDTTDLVTEETYDWMVGSAGEAFKIGGDNYDSYYTSFGSRGNLITGTLTPDILYAVPFVNPSYLVINRIGINVTSAIGGGLARLGIYKNRNGHPRRLIWDAGEVDLSSIGPQRIGGPRKFRGGMLWLAILTNASVGIHCFNPDSIHSPIGYAPTLPPNPRYGFTASQAYGSLPDPYPGYAVSSFITSSPIPTIFIKYDSVA